METGNRYQVTGYRKPERLRRTILCIVQPVSRP
jgi:hypothetical protein